MKRIFTLCISICTAMIGFAQADTTAKQPTEKADTIKVGGMIIIRKAGDEERETRRSRNITITNRHDYKHNANVSTNWWIVDLGFANVNDQTNYSSAAVQDPVSGFAPGLNKDNLKLRTGKSVNVNLWFFMQRLNLIEHVVNLKYGLGIELNNYRYEENIKFTTNPTSVIMDTISYSKNKLAADYVTVPFMLNFNFTPHRRHDYGFSVGASVGYRYSSRQKFKSKETGKYKTFDDFDMDPWKISWIGELQLGWLKLYGSYATKSMFLKGLDQRPYTVGLRFGNW